MYAYADLELEQKRAALLVPVQAVSRAGNKASVMLVTPQNKLELREIVLGMETPEAVEVLTGLAENDRVVLGNLVLVPFCLGQDALFPARLARARAVANGRTQVNEEDLKATFSDFLPPSYPLEVELQSLGLRERRQAGQTPQGDVSFEDKNAAFAGEGGPVVAIRDKPRLSHGNTHPAATDRAQCAVAVDLPAAGAAVLRW
jgi:hypothetical protein